jgi:esterase/lipase
MRSALSDSPLAAAVLPEDLDGYLAASEARFDGITPGAEKKIIWHDPQRKQRTPLALVYIHGFSACRQELSPVCETVARQLGANIFLTRLTGHGQDSQAMASASLAAWQNDAIEAFMIGRRLGQKVALVGTSTGGTLSVWLAGQDRGQRVAALILVSPNFGIRHMAAGMLTWPGAFFWLPWMMGRTRGWKPINEQHAKYWTIRYPITALIPMMQAVQTVSAMDLSKITAPMLFIYSLRDQIVNAALTERAFDAMGSTRKRKMYIEASQHTRQHVIAGNILSPNNNGRVIDEMTTFLGALAPGIK